MALDFLPLFAQSKNFFHNLFSFGKRLHVVETLNQEPLIFQESVSRSISMCMLWL